MYLSNLLKHIILANLILVIVGLSYFIGFTSGIRNLEEVLEEHQSLKSGVDQLYLKLASLQEVARYSSLYRINFALAQEIYEAALEAKIDPPLGFALVDAESRFNPRALGVHGEIGLTQIRPETARELRPTLKVGDLWNPSLNLRLGFQFLRRQLDYYGGNVGLALLAYNRGRATVDDLLALNLDPRNGYARRVQMSSPGLPF